MPSRYPDLYPELFADLDPSAVSLALQSIGSTHDGRLRPREDVADAVERGRQMRQRIDQRRAELGLTPDEADGQPD